MTRTLLRFTRSERAVHWLLAVCVLGMFATGVLMAEGLVLWLHVGFAALLPLGWALILLGPGRRRVVGTLRGFTRFDSGDRDWLASAPQHLSGRGPEPPQGRFNAGQKLNALGVAVALAVLFASGTALLLSLGGVGFLHGPAAVGLAALLAGHLYMALVNPRTRPALRGMTHGDVTRAWAEQHHPHWVAEMDGEDLSRERQQT